MPCGHFVSARRAPLSPYSLVRLLRTSLYGNSERTMAQSPRSIPFVNSRPLTPAEAAPRTRDANHLVELAEGGHNATLVAPRRMGKTSLLNQVQREAENAGMHAVLVDLSDVLSIEDVAARLDLAFRRLRGP